MRGLGVRRHADGSLHLRPGGAVVLSIAVWAVCAALVAQAVAVAGWDGVLLAPIPLLICVLVWATLWRPRVILRPDAVRVRNVFSTADAPMAQIADVRLGAMLRLRLHDGRVLTAWNAPGVGKDDHRDRLARMQAQERSTRGGSRAAGRGRAQAAGRSTWSDRLVADQLASPSYAVVEAWQAWRAQHGESDAASAAAPDVTRAPNTLVLLVLAAAGVLAALRVVL